MRRKFIGLLNTLWFLLNKNLIFFALTSHPNSKGFFVILWTNLKYILSENNVRTRSKIRNIKLRKKEFNNTVPSNRFETMHLPSHDHSVVSPSNADLTLPSSSVPKCTFPETIYIIWHNTRVMFLRHSKA